MKTIILILQCCAVFCVVPAQPINRKALVQRHNVINHRADTLSSLTLGNGKFAFTTDVTGLQSFPEAYSKGVPLGTQSEWGWDSFTNTAGYRFEETLLSDYSVQRHTPERNKQASDWFRQNVHRLQLGNIGFEIIKKDGTVCRLEDIKNINQELDLYNGLIKSHFTVDDIPVDVQTAVHPQQDIISVKIKSDLIKAGRLKIKVRFPYPTNEFADVGVNYKGKHSSAIIGETLVHQLDNYKYYLQITGGRISNAGLNEFYITPTGECTFHFTEKPVNSLLKEDVEKAATTYWNNYWQHGGMVDFSGSTDPRAFELERRIILSQYLMAVQCAGNMPPQETGLTYNSWYGKPHLEMYWWHAVHFALWNRIELLEKSLQWYATVAGKASDIAKRQGYKGLRWQKMTDPKGDESPSSVGAFLIWQQPHYIYMTELVYRHYHNRATLDKYKDLVFATADFMASYATYDSATKRYLLNKVIPAQERFKPEQTFNPTFELAYWRWGLTTAQQWRERLGLKRRPEWDAVLKDLSPLPQQNGVYLATESAPDSYTNPTFLTDHPAVLGTYGMIPGEVDTAVMHRTFNKIWDTWNWKDTWGWDFPLTSMTATRLGLKQKAIDALFMPVQTNTWLPNGHNYQDERLRLYLPGNGGLLSAVALMCAGYDGCTIKNPGIPDDGSWKVKWEDLQPMP